MKKLTRQDAAEFLYWGCDILGDHFVFYDDSMSSYYTAPIESLDILAQMLEEEGITWEMPEGWNEKEEDVYTQWCIRTNVQEVPDYRPVSWDH